MKLSGAQIKKFINSIMSDDYHRVQISGFKIFYQKESDNIPNKFKLKNIIMDNGDSLKDNEFYTVAAPNYISAGNDGYTMFNAGIDKQDTLIGIRDALNDFITAGKHKEYIFTNRIILSE